MRNARGEAEGEVAIEYPDSDALEGEMRVTLIAGRGTYTNAAGDVHKTVRTGVTCAASCRRAAASRSSTPGTHASALVHLRRNTLT